MPLHTLHLHCFKADKFHFLSATIDPLSSISSHWRHDVTKPLQSITTPPSTTSLYTIYALLPGVTSSAERANCARKKTGRTTASQVNNNPPSVFCHITSDHITSCSDKPSVIYHIISHGVVTNPLYSTISCHVSYSTMSLHNNTSSLSYHNTPTVLMKHVSKPHWLSKQQNKVGNNN